MAHLRIFLGLVLTLIAGCEPVIVKPEIVMVPGETEFIEMPGETVVITVPGETKVVEVEVPVEVLGPTEYVEVEACPTFLLPGTGGPIEVPDLLVSQTGPTYFFGNWSVSPWLDLATVAPEGCGGVILRNAYLVMVFEASDEEIIDIATAIDGLGDRPVWVSRQVAPPNNWETVASEPYTNVYFSPDRGDGFTQVEMNISIDWEVPAEQWSRLVFYTRAEEWLPTDRMVGLTMFVNWQLAGDTTWFSTSHGSTIFR
jgi:hypothetical protein